MAEIARVAPAARLKAVTCYYKKKAKLLSFSERIKHRQWWVEDIALVLFEIGSEVSFIRPLFEDVLVSNCVLFRSCLLILKCIPRQLSRNDM